MFRFVDTLLSYIRLTLTVDTLGPPDSHLSLGYLGRSIRKVAVNAGSVLYVTAVTAK